MPIEFLIGMAAALIIESVKNPQHRSSLKKVMLKIRNVINQAYLGDPDFQ